MTRTDFYALDWFGLDWSDWKSLNADSFSEIPKQPGIYRIRHQNPERDFLEYIGESGDTRRRLQSLARGTFADEMPYRDPHTAAPCLWAIRDKIGPQLEYSFTTASNLEGEQHRKGTEDALIALHRRETNQSPTANFGRMIEGYKQSSYSYNEPAYKGGPLEPDEKESNTASGVAPPEWQNWRSPLDDRWMGLDWSEPYLLEDRLNANPPENGVYRIWYRNNSLPLAYIGESSSIPNRLYKHEQTFGEKALFAYAERIELDASHMRQEIETDLIGAHYLTEGKSPIAQFGHKERLPE